jgi:YjbE family integral membrane protein
LICGFDLRIFFRSRLSHLPPAAGRARRISNFPCQSLKNWYRMLESSGLSGSAIALLQIMIINVVLSGDNAVVIALACRRLSPAHQKQAFLWGSAGAVVLMVVLTMFVVFLLDLPYLQLAGSLLLLWVGVKLLAGDHAAGDGKVEEKATLVAAVRTIIVADIVMSLDNVLAMAGAAKGHLWMLIAGLAITIPVIRFGSALLMKLMEKFPVVIAIGAAVIGWVAGDMLIADPALKDWVETNASYLHAVSPLACALLVVAAGKLLERSRAKRRMGAGPP